MEKQNTVCVGSCLYFSTPCPARKNNRILEIIFAFHVVILAGNFLPLAYQRMIVYTRT